MSQVATNENVGTFRSCMSCREPWQVCAIDNQLPIIQWVSKALIFPIDTFIIVQMPSTNIICIAGNRNWLVRHTGPHFDIVHECFILKVEQDTLQVTPLGLDLHTQCVGHLPPDQESSSDRCTSTYSKDPIALPLTKYTIPSFICWIQWHLQFFQDNIYILFPLFFLNLPNTMNNLNIILTSTLNTEQIHIKSMVRSWKLSTAGIFRFIKSHNRHVPHYLL